MVELYKKILNNLSSSEDVFEDPEQKTSIQDDQERKSLCKLHTRRPIMAPIAIPIRKLPRVWANVVGAPAEEKLRILIQIIS